MNTIKYFMKASKLWDNSYSVFQRDRLNEFGEPFCVDPALSYEEARKTVDALNSDPQEAIRRGLSL